MIPLLAFALSVSLAEAPAPPDAAASPSAVTAALSRFDDATAAERRAYHDLSARDGVAANLAARVALDQEMRRAIGPALAGLDRRDRDVATAAIWRRITPFDVANTAYLQSVLPADGWFRARRDGADVALNAWIIVQHSSDTAFQRQVVARMAPLIATGDAQGRLYALLYDRTEMEAGRPQRYGSQMLCVSGRWQLAPLSDPKDLARRRAQMGLPPIEEYLKNYTDTC